MPPYWNHLYGMLRNYHPNPAGGWTPPLPLIMTFWRTTQPLEKQQRLREHLQWALEHEHLDQIGNFLRALPEDDWFHFDDPLTKRTQLKV